MSRQFTSTEDALAYMTECTLATVQDLRMKSRTPKGELARQIAIAQRGIDWIKATDGCIRRDTRVTRVLSSGGRVEEWSKQYE